MKTFIILILGAAIGYFTFQLLQPVQTTARPEIQNVNVVNTPVNKNVDNLRRSYERRISEIQSQDTTTYELMGNGRKRAIKSGAQITRDNEIAELQRKIAELK